MARRRTEPYKRGETARLRPKTGHGDEVKITAPNGDLLIRKAPRAYADVVLDQVGDWSYEWAVDDYGKIEVVEPVVVVAEELTTVVAPTSRLVSRGA